MRHDPDLARALEPRIPPVSSWPRLALRAAVARTWDGVCIRLGILALVLVPGRFLAVWIWPASAHFLGFSS